MLIAPYSIYVNRRPLRVAFLIEDKPDSLAILDTIFQYNRDRWGGRYNPIVITDGQTLTDAWWSLLEAVDPDVVKSFVTLSDNLVASIERRISPYIILQPDHREQEDDYQHLNLPDEALTILPTALNVRMGSWTHSAPNLVLFETDWQKTDPLIKRFVEWNFGGYSHPIHSVALALEDVLTQRYSVTDAESLVRPLTELSNFAAFTYPIQLCSLPKEALAEVEYDRQFGEGFNVVIGDTPIDVAYFWNRPSTIPQWCRTYLNQVWLPLHIATNAQLSSALSSWLQRAADPDGNYRGRIQFVSLTLSEAQLLEVVEPLARELRVFRNVAALREIHAPKIQKDPPGPPGQAKMDLYRVASTTERLTIEAPPGPYGPRLDEHWMVDLYIEFRPERSPAIVGRPLWWQLPRFNSLAWHMFGRQSRILRTRYPSVLMKRGESRLDITLLDDISVFVELAALPNNSYPLDARHEKTFPGRFPYYEARRSEKGRYLSGLLDLFGGLYPTTRTLEERYWRRMFNILSGRTAQSEAERLKEVGNALRKRLGANRAQFYEDDKAVTWLTNYVLKVARSLPASSRDLEFRIFEEHAKQEIEDFNALQPGQKPWVYSRADLLDSLTDLTERGVLLIGVQARCPSCGYRAWHHIDDAKQTLRCGGCNYAFSMPPEQSWYYRLNSLARAAVAEHGLLPVVLVMGQLLMDARSAFLFAPCLDLFEKDGKGPVGDLDIAVIVDGQFVIGEVKQSRNLFDEATFAKMETMARRLLPDVLLFASMEREPTVLIRKQIQQLSERLQPLSVTVQWYPLHEYKFEASPVR